MRLSPFLLTILAGLFFALPASMGLAFSIASRTRDIPEAGKVRESFVVSDDHEFAFIAPDGWRPGVNEPEKRLTWMSRDMGTLLEFRLFPGKTRAALSPELLQAEIKMRHPQAKVGPPFPCFTSGLSGWAADVELIGPGDLRRGMRIAWIPFPRGYIEVNVTSSLAAFPKQQRVLGHFMNSLRVTPSLQPPAAPSGTTKESQRGAGFPTR